MIKYRSAIVGCGGRARMHALAYQFITGGELVACCDLDEIKREVFAAEFGLHSYLDATEMIQKEKPDLVHLVTAPNSRVGLMKLVDEQNIPACIVEKPISTEVQDWKALVALSKSTKTRFGVGAQFRYHPDMVRIREFIRSGKLGAVRFLDFSAVGTICDQGVHGLDWAMSLIDDSVPRRIFGFASGADNLYHPMHPSPDTSLAKITFANDIEGIWINGWTAPRVLEDPAYYKHGRVCAYTEKGYALYEEFGKWEMISPSESHYGSVNDLGWLHGNHLAQAALTDGMFQWMEGGLQVGTNLRTALIQWNAVLGLYASTVWRKPIDLPFDPPDNLWDMFVRTLQ